MLCLAAKVYNRAVKIPIIWDSGSTPTPAKTAKESTPGTPTPLYSRNLFTTNWQIGTPTPTPTPAKMAKESTPGTQTPDSFTALQCPIIRAQRFPSIQAKEIKSQIELSGLSNLDQ